MNQPHQRARGDRQSVPKVANSQRKSGEKPKIDSGTSHSSKICGFMETPSRSELFQFYLRVEDTRLKYFIQPTQEYISRYGPEFLKLVGEHFAYGATGKFAMVEFSLGGGAIVVELFTNYANRFFYSDNALVNPNVLREFDSQRILFAGLGRTLLYNAITHTLNRTKPAQIKWVRIGHILGRLGNREMTGLFDYYRRLGFTAETGYQQPIGELLRTLSTESILNFTSVGYLSK